MKDIRAVLVVVSLTAGCASHWGSRRLDRPQPVKSHEVVWVWTRGVLNKWRAVVFTTDSVSGIPYGRSLKCDTCRRSLPLAQVDSMRLDDQQQKVDAKGALDVAGVVGMLLLVEVAVCSVVVAVTGAKSCG